MLSTTAAGETGSRVVFCHGLFGQGKNWSGIGKALADEHRVLFVDLPDHGTSPRSERFDYLAMADQVAEVLEPGDTLVGHSMGGKTAMLAALRHRELVERLVVVDVAPVAYEHAAEFEGYLRAMQAIDLDTLASRSAAHAALREAVPTPTVRGFLLQSLQRGDDAEGAGWRWLLNLDLLLRDLDQITDWPAEAVADAAPYEGPVLWVGGATSHYVTEASVAAMDRLFPRNRRVKVKGAGHWVHSEQPAVFVEVLRRFLDR